MKIFYKHFNYYRYFSIFLVLVLGTCSHALLAQAACSQAASIKILPFSKKGLSSCGKGSHYSEHPLCLDQAYFGGEDYVFTYTPPTDACIDIDISFINKKANYTSFAGLAVFDDCPSRKGA